MEKLRYEFPASQTIGRRAHVGVVGSGDLEVLIEPSPGQTTRVEICTSVNGFGPTWENVLNRFITRFPFAEGWHLAKQIRAVVEADRMGEKRAIIAVIDVPSQAYGRREELLGIFLAAAAATDAYVWARKAGHPIIGLIVGSAISGGFLTHGIQANRLLAFDDPKVTVHAMAKIAAARVTRRTLEELDRLAETVVPMSYKVADYARLGTLYQLISGVDVDSPNPNQIERVKTQLAAAIASARAGSLDLNERYESSGARKLRKATLEVRQRMAAEWV